MKSDDNVQDAVPQGAGPGTEPPERPGWLLQAEFAVGMALFGGPNISLALMNIPATPEVVELAAFVGGLMMIRSVVAARREIRAKVKR